MKKIALTAQVREKAGKGVARSLRRDAQVPAVLYSHGKSTPIAMVNKDVTKVLNTEGGEHALINLKLDESLHVRHIPAPEGVKILSDADATVATIQPPISDAKLEAMLTATPAAATEAGEPELVKKPKKEGEAAAAAPAAEAKGKEASKEAPKKEAAPKK